MNKNNVKSAIATDRFSKLGLWAEKHTMLLAMTIAGLMAALFVALTSNIGTGLAKGLFG